MNFFSRPAAGRVLDWAGVIDTLRQMEGRDAAVLVGGLGAGRVVGVGVWREVQSPRDWFAFAVGTTVTTLHPERFVEARWFVLPDGHVVVEVNPGETSIVVGTPDVLVSDYEEDPSGAHPEDRDRDVGG